MPGMGRRGGGGCRGGGAVGHVVEPGGIGIGAAGNGIAGATGAVKKSGATPFGGGICERIGGAGSTPVVGTGV